jgi:hypothetical protein
MLTANRVCSQVLAGKQKPNLGKFENPPDWQEILAHFRGSELQNYFTKILEDNLKAIIKPQYVDHIPKAIPAGSTVQDILTGTYVPHCECRTPPKSIGNARVAALRSLFPWLRVLSHGLGIIVCVHDSVRKKSHPPVPSSRLASPTRLDVAVLRFSAKDERKVKDEHIELLELQVVMDRAVADLSGGELQRFATAVVCIQVTHCATERLPVACIDENLLRVAMLVRKTDLSGLCWKRFEFGGLTDCSKLTCTCSTNPHRTSMSNSASPLLVYANTSHPPSLLRHLSPICLVRPCPPISALPHGLRIRV